ncbi:large ribosomal subunit protein uL3m-like isoform X2 [Clytia hemisphaerica]|uniref:large ribosomal subunit protein uL3m-like isoform X2 n=1 Tax=Clytia hemisphaerica TaxID=252671 RepID=UPI0034D4DD33
MLSRFRNVTIRHGKESKIIFTSIRSSSQDAPKNLFEVYEKNSHWMGQYERNPVIKTKISQNELSNLIGKESNRLAPLDLEHYISEHKREWQAGDLRTGAIGRKLGMSVLWTKEGFRHAVTLVQTSREKLKWYLERGLFPKEFWAAFKVTNNALLMPGTEINASHFKPGQFIHLRGTTIYQGFQGVMKRWGMKGQPKTHGQSKTHRKMGATGGGQDPGRIFPGKKMAGVVGGKNSTTPPLKIFRINTKYNILYIKGHVPGEVGGFLRIHDSRYKKYPKPPYFPTIEESEMESLEEDLFEDHVVRPTDLSLEFPPYKL